MSSISRMQLQPQPPPPTSPQGSENERIGVKKMEKRCIEFAVKKYSSLESIDIGESIRCSGIVVGGKLFTIEFYPNGWDVEAYNWGNVSLFVKNENEIRVDIVCDLFILSQYGDRFHVGYSFSDDRGFYKQVSRVEGGERFGYEEFWPKQSIQSLGCVKDDGSIIIRATLGVFIDAKVDLPLPLERCVLFQLGYEHYYMEESVIATRCPSLLSNSNSQSDYVLISDVDNHVFKAMLWFIDNQIIHEEDRRAIVESKDSHPNSFAPKILAAADRFHLKDLRTQCEFLVSNAAMAQLYYHIQSDFKTLRTRWCMLWAKMKEAISQKSKEF